MNKTKMKGTIYLISNSVDDMIYIGSTSRRLSQRMGCHRTNARAEVKESKLYKHMRAIGVSKWTIKALKVKEVADRKQLEQLEFKWMQLYPRDLLLNMTTVYGERSIEHVKKVGIAQRGQKTSKFNRGSIMRIQRLTHGYSTDLMMFRWFVWVGDKRYQKSKSFSILKYGEKEARGMAEEYRNKIYPQ